MCTRACRRAFVRALPIIFALWFAVELMVVGGMYYSYVNYLIGLYNLDMVFYVEFSGTSLGMIVCVVAFVFIRCDLIGLIIPLIIFCLIWLISFGLFFAQSVMDYLFYGTILTHSLVRQVVDEEGKKEKMIPLMIKKYQIVNSCCILHDSKWTWAPKTEKVYSCCLSLIKCQEKKDWFFDKCIPKLLLEYNYPARRMVHLNIVSLFLLLFLFVIYIRKFVQERRKRKLKQKLEKEAVQSNDSVQNPTHDHGESPSTPIVNFCVCSC